jgi:hypothetical protein
MAGIFVGSSVTKWTSISKPNGKNEAVALNLKEKLAIARNRTGNSLTER